MKPIGLTFKHEGYGRQGELMLIHQCAVCEQLSINRIAADDDEDRVLEAFDFSCQLTDKAMNRLVRADVILLTQQDMPEIRTQLFGKAD